MPSFIPSFTITCPHCGSPRVEPTSDSPARHLWRCHACAQTFWVFYPDELEDSTPAPVDIPPEALS